MRMPEKYRTAHPVIGLNPWDQEGGYFLIPHHTEHALNFAILATIANGWEQVSVTIREGRNRPDRCPYWDEMNYIKNVFWEDEEAVMQLHPPLSTYVNNHQFCLHLWKPLRKYIPLPPSCMVGIT